MLTWIQWVYLAVILLGTFAGGYVPLFRPKQAREERGFPLGQAFTAGVFLALALVLMLPSAFTLFRRAWPEVNYPITSLIVVGTFLFLLFLEHFAAHLRVRINKPDLPAETNLSPVAIPLIMTAMIAVPSFFLGAALGVSGPEAAFLIFIAILAHKSSAGFALALTMVRSRLTHHQTLATYTLFACSTPIGILAGAAIHRYLGMDVMIIVKATILSLAAGTFLFMGTLHELRQAPLVAHCGHKLAFLVMLAGFVLTALVRLLIGEAHSM